ncbi:MAG TPA: translation initiation factor [Candidatus Kapabacteria bacterium]|nr:translation initiation factor [Candidatus Kapabacteria bacterium]
MKLHDLSHLSTLLSKDDAEAIAKEAVVKQAKRKLGEGQEVRVLLDRKARRGKAVTVIEGLRLSTEMRDKLAKTLKQKYSAGGTAERDTIELQGDHVARVVEYLKENGFTVRPDVRGASK